ncbi:MAG: hypothetical protein HY655_01965 [Acidobacteria bacterium]|nr:hypothetical protein [Acidobacteriota bacterium]
MTSLKTHPFLAGLVILLAGTMTAHVSGHHGTSASYDHSKQVTVTGKVTEFRWRNPHSALFIDVTNEKGERVNWSIEMGSPATLMRSGWSSRTFTAGDEVSIVVHPSRAGAPAGVCAAAPCTVIVNGKPISRVPEP